MCAPWRRGADGDAAPEAVVPLHVDQAAAGAVQIGPQSAGLQADARQPQILDSLIAGDRTCRGRPLRQTRPCRREA